MIAAEEGNDNFVKSKSGLIKDDDDNKIIAMQGVCREVIDPSEDSGFSTTSGGSGSESNISTDKDKNEETIGEGIKFINPDLIAQEQKIKLSKIKRQDPELLAEKRAAKEAFEKEIQERQYNRLMHLLKESKALTNFVVKKRETVTRKRKGKKDEDEPKAKRGKQSNTTKQSGDKRKANNLNLSQEDIQKELDNISDGETEDKENSGDLENFKQSKYFIGDLRSYQKVGVNWLTLLYENGLNGILADEMGLGKTIQVIALFAALIEKNQKGPYMIIVPLSTLSNWESEFKKFAPKLPVVTFYGNISERACLKPKIEKKYPIGNYSTYPVVLMTYEMPIYEKSYLKQFNWRYIVIDEAQRIKNYNTQLFRILKSYNSANRLLLTGTPLQNNLTELWSLLNFLLPEIFNNLEVFQSWFDAKEVQHEKGKKKILEQEQEKHVLATLREILQPFMLRRLKEEACPDIPPMKEVLIYTPLTAIQYDIYSAIIQRDLSKLHKIKIENPIIDVNGVRPRRKCTIKYSLDEEILSNRKSFSALKEDITLVGNTKIKKDELTAWNEVTKVTAENIDYFVRLRFGNDVIMYRHVVNHPYLVHYPKNDCGVGLVNEDLVKKSGKLLVLDAMLKKLKANGHKVLLFSTMTLVLDIIEDYLSLRDYEYVRLDGSIKYDARRNSIEEFQTNPNVFLFLLSTRAGAVGLNLAAADTVIIYDSDWNPQCDLQAMARCHRIGQIKPVVVYRLCTKGTIDEEIIRRANAKRFLEKAVISKEANMVNSEEGLMKLQKLLDEDGFKVIDSKNNVYTDAELDEMLDRSDMVSLKKVEDNAECKS